MADVIIVSNGERTSKFGEKANARPKSEPRQARSELSTKMVISSPS
jgi:hypothetical protein